jgi:hypothetical protein
MKQAFLFAQGLEDKALYSMKHDATANVSRMTAYRYIKELESLGVLMSVHGKFILNTGAINQSLTLFKKLLPSLRSLKSAIRFGKSYDESDINFTKKNIQSKLITLDYKAWELTKYQSPLDLYMYVADMNLAAKYLRQHGFHEGQNGHVVILPTIGDFTNEIQRIYFDCIAHGGRSLRDAIAIELLYGDKLESKARFSIEDVKDVDVNLKTMHNK